MSRVKPRARQWGDVEQRSSGRWRARYVGPDGERYAAPETFSAKLDALTWLAEQQKAIRDERWTREAARARAQHRGRTLGEYAHLWIETRLNSRGEPLRPRTREEYERLLDGPLEALTSVPLRSLTASMVRQWHAGASSTGRATQTARAYGLLRTLVASALRDKAMSEDVCDIRGAGNARTGRKVLPPTDSELRVILESITPRFRAAVLVAAWAGTRFGELSELRRSDIEVARDGAEVFGVVIHITRAVTFTTSGGAQVGPTKSSAGVRAVALPPHIFDEVLAHLREHVEPNADALLFPGGHSGRHLRQSTFTKHWYPARKAAKREDMPFHALRHHGATKYAQTGATLAEVQSRLGHSTVAAAMRYQHAIGRDRELAARMSEMASLDTSLAT